MPKTSNPIIRIKSEQKCPRCWALLPYPFLHICDPSKLQENQDCILARQAGGQAVMSFVLLCILSFCHLAFAAEGKTPRQEELPKIVFGHEIEQMQFYGICHKRIIDYKQAENGDWALYVEIDPKGCAEMRKAKTVKS